MSLKIWLPLNGDLTNQGLSNATVTNYGATVDTNGKIGKCYSFDGSDDYIQLSSFNMSGLEEYTISCWVKPNDSSISYLFLVRGGGTHQIRISGDGLMFRDTKNSTQRIVVFGEAFVPDKWVHICCVYNRGEIFMYQDGVQTAHSTSYYHADSQTNSGLTEIRIGRSQSSSGNSYFSGCVNDFRIYDNALSAKEIYKLSRGLIAWFPLSPKPVYNRTGNNIYTTANIAKANSSSSYSVSAISDTSFRLYTNKNVAYASTKQTVASLGLTVGKRYRMKCKIDITRLDTRIIVGLRDSNNTYRASTGNLYEGGIYEYEFVLTSDMSYLSFLGTYESSQCDITFSDIEIYELQEEDIIHDISGYQRNGIKTNVVFSPDTPKYNGSSYFDGTSLIQANSLPAEVKTISVWCKTTKNKSTSQFICQDSVSGLCVTFYKGTIISHLGGSSSTGSKCTLGDSYIENGWNHFVVLKTGTHTREVYCNGVKLTPTSNDYWSANTGFFVGARNASKTYPFYGYISDLRAYTTLLSEEDILDLYHAPISLISSDILQT